MRLLTKCPLAVLCIFAPLLQNVVALATAPEPSDAFRADSTLSFMRHLRGHRKQKQEPTPNPKAPVVQAEEALEDAVKNPFDPHSVKGPKGKEAPKKQTPPVVKAGDAINDMGKDIGDAMDASGKGAGKAVERVKKGPKSNKKPYTADTPPVVDAEKKGTDMAKNGPKSGKPVSADKAPIVDGEDAASEAWKNSNTPQPEEAKVEEPEQQADAEGCRNDPAGWVDTQGNDCEAYEEGEYCTRRGGYGDAWLDEWGTFEDVAKDGKSAKDVCCVCGGGTRELEVKAGEPAAAASPAAAPAPVWEGKKVLGGKLIKPLQEQGYSGELVAHEDESTMTEDWGREFGPNAGHRDIRTICKEHPDNEWCTLHGYDIPLRSSSSSWKIGAAVFLALFLA